MTQYRTFVFALGAWGCLAVPVEAGHPVSFKGTWSGGTVSAEPTDDPNVIFVITEGTGHATGLGKYTMVSPHLSFLDTGEVVGFQIFTAANGDELWATLAGQFLPTPDGFLAADLDCRIFGGTGRFRRARGRYVFQIVFDPQTFQSMATIRGRINRP